MYEMIPWVRRKFGVDSTDIAEGGYDLAQDQMKPTESLAMKPLQGGATRKVTADWKTFKYLGKTKPVSKVVRFKG